MKETSNSTWVVREITKKYKLLQSIGEGGFGVLFRGSDRSNGEIIALKISQSNDVTLNELKLHNQLHHRNICQLKRSEILLPPRFLPSAPSFCLLSMELMDIDLADYVLQLADVISLAFIQFVFREVCLAVQFCHSQRIAHLDLKLDNILLQLNGNSSSSSLHSSISSASFEDIKVKLCDFGFAHKWKKNVNNAKCVLTEYYGTENYRAPEIVLAFDEKWNHHFNDVTSSPVSMKRRLGREFSLDKLDMFSLGVVLFSLLTMEFPLEYRNIDDMRNIMENNQFILKEWNVPPSAIDLLDQLLSFNPEERPSIDDVLSHPFLNTKL